MSAVKENFGARRAGVVHDDEILLREDVKGLRDVPVETVHKDGLGLNLVEDGFDVGAAVCLRPFALVWLRDPSRRLQQGDSKVSVVVWQVVGHLRVFVKLLNLSKRSMQDKSLPIVVV